MHNSSSSVSLPSGGIAGAEPDAHLLCFFLAQNTFIRKLISGNKLSVLVMAIAIDLPAIFPSFCSRSLEAETQSQQLILVYSL